jgi:hypothetical protein
MLLSILYLILPNPGNIYRKIVSHSFFGNQNIETEFIDQSLISIRLSGVINCEGTAKYTLIDDIIDIELSDNLKLLMKNTNTKFILKNYDDKNDIINIDLYIKSIIYRKNIKLTRVN